MQSLRAGTSWLLVTAVNTVGTVLRVGAEQRACGIGGGTIQVTAIHLLSISYYHIRATVTHVLLVI